MICFEVWVNGEKICLAGVGESGVLNAIIDGARKQRKSNLHIGGLVNDEYVHWTKKEHILEVGDEVTIKIVEADTANEPIRKYPRKDSSKSD